MKEKELVYITGLGIEIPGVSDINNLLELLNSRTQSSKSISEEKPVPKGFRYKDRATQLALFAAKAALLDAGLPILPSEQLSPEAFGVVASSNLGNLDTVCRVHETIRSSHVKYTSPMDLPNLSSNVVATSVAIQFGLKAINLMLCNGATSGIDALYVAANAIRTGRASRILVVGVEPVNQIVVKLMSESLFAWLGTPCQLSLGEAAGAVVLESFDAVLERNASIYGNFGGYSYEVEYDIKKSMLSATKKNLFPLDLWLTPNCSYEKTSKYVKQTLEFLDENSSICALDIGTTLGEVYGALGILQCITACIWLRIHQKQRAIATSGTTWGDGVASILIERF
jgi:3-oxoacyl-[acyl-carrier-protein] synthase II